MSVLVDLPSDLVHDILQNWCDVADLRVIDLSLTNRSQRKTYLSVLRTICVSNEHDLKCPKTDNFYMWVALRGTSLYRLVLSGKNFDFYQKSLRIPLDLSKVQCLALRDFASNCDLAGSIINSSSPVRILEVYCEKIFFVLCDSLFVNLLSINVSLLSCEEPLQLMNRLCLCRNLKRLSLRLSLQCDFHLLDSIVTTNPHLTFIMVNCDIRIVKSITRHCHRIECVLISSEVRSVENTYALVLDLMVSRPTVKKVHLTGGLSGFLYENDSICIECDSLQPEIIDLLSSVRGLKMLFVRSWTRPETLANDLPRAILMNGTTLKTLDLNSYIVLSGTSLDAIVKACVNLEELSCSTDVAEAELLPIFHDARVLRCLNLHFKDQVSLKVVHDVFCLCSVLNKVSFEGVICDASLDDFAAAISLRYLEYPHVNVGVVFLDPYLNQYDRRMTFREGHLLTRCL